MELADYSNILWNTMLECGIDEKEANYRYGRLKAVEECEGSLISGINHRYYEIAHEIKCIQFLKQFGRITVSRDSRSEAGCDCVLKEKYHVEFVCCSGGEVQIRELNNYCGIQDGLIEYGDKERLMLLRITSSVKEKKEFYQEHAKLNVTLRSSPYIVFLGLGELAPEMIVGEYGIDFCSVLVGKGRPTILLNTKTQEIVQLGYEYRNNIEKKPGVKINANIWMDPEYSDISAIIISAASLYEQYDTNNTWMFINPRAKQKIIKKDFKGMIYWTDNAGKYFPCKNWRQKMIKW